MQIVAVGKDRVEIHADRVVVHARHAFDDWRVREFCRQPIHFAGGKYYLAAKADGERGFSIRYELFPWPEDLHEESDASFHYDAASVAARDTAIAADRGRSLAWFVLLPFYPFLGLLWSGFKDRVLWPLGFVPVSITSASVMLVFCAVFVDALFFGFLGGGAVMGLLGPRSLSGWAIAGDLLLIGILALDCVTRFSQLLRGDAAVPWGFLEWLVPARWRHGE